MPEDEPSLARVPEAHIAAREKTRISIVWIIPIVAALIGAWVAVQRIRSAGPEISIRFDTAEGLEAGKTKIHYNGVDIGTLSTIRLSDDHTHVIATAAMAPKTEDLLVEDTRFWVVRPRISGANVSGLGTLISGAYIGMEIGKEKQPRTDFVGLETPPVVTGGAGRFLVLKTAELGSLDTGTPIFFRKLQVGEVASYELDKDGRGLTVKAFVRAPYDQYVTANTRFWHASGVDLSLSASGLTVQTESILSLLIGGIAFETPATGPVLPEVEANTVFTLFEDRKAAFALPPQDPQVFVLRFDRSVRGLEVGAPVEIQGIPIGEVTEIRPEFDARTAAFSVPVTVRLDAGRLGVAILNRDEGEDRATTHRRAMDLLISHGFRLQLQTANLLTGAMMVSADFFPDAPPATIDWSKSPVELPTATGGLEALEAGLARVLKRIEALPLESIGADAKKTITDLDAALVSARGAIDHVDDLVVNKVGSMPFQSIADDLRKSIADFDAMLQSTRRTVESVDSMVQPNSALAGDLANTLDNVARAARDLGQLLDYLQRHPEALLRGKPGDSK